MPLYAEKNAYLFHRNLFHYLPNPFFVAFPSYHHRRYSRHCEAEKNLFFNVLPIPPPTHTPARIIFRLFIGLMGIWIARFCRGQLLPKRLSSKLIGGFYRKTVFIIWSCNFFMPPEIPFGSPCLCRIHAFLY